MNSANSQGGEFNQELRQCGHRAQQPDKNDRRLRCLIEQAAIQTNYYPDYRNRHSSAALFISTFETTKVQFNARPARINPGDAP